MFKQIEAVHKDGSLMTITINSENIVFLSEVDIPSNIKGLNGEPKTKKGTAISLSNGIMLNSELTENEIVKLFEE